MKSLRKLIRPAVFCILLFGVGRSLMVRSEMREKLVYTEHLKDVAVSVDDKGITFEDLAFYILYEECTIEQQAMIYNGNSTKDYWNLHINGTFVQDAAKEAVLDMAVHDEVLSRMAETEGMKLTDEELQALENRTADFWEDLLDGQEDRMPVDKEIINLQIEKVALAEKYQNYLAEEKGPSKAAYNFDGYYYEQILNEHKIKINNKLCDRLVMGDITLYHDKVNYVNGVNGEE